MKNTSRNLIILFVLSVAFAALAACEKRETIENGANVEVASTDRTTATEAKNSNDGVTAPAAIVEAPISDLDGNSFKIADKKGKVVMVNLWAIWCGPCIAEMPEFVKLQEEYKDKDFEIIGLNTGDEEGNQVPPEEIKKFGEKLNINYQLAYSDRELVNEFIKKSKMQGIPQTFLFNREGQLTNIFTGGGLKMVNSIKENVGKIVNQ